MRIVVQGSQIAIESGQQILHQSLKRDFLLAGEQASFVSATEKVPRFVERAAGYSDETLVIDRGSTAISFGDVGPHTVGGTDKLVTDGRFGEGAPSESNLPYAISQLFGHGVDLEACECELGHGDESRRPGSRGLPNY